MMNRFAALSLVLVNIANLSGLFLHSLDEIKSSFSSNFDSPVHNVEVVVAQYSEDLSWVDLARERDPNIRYTVYSKGPEPPQGTLRLPNVGRESHTFLYHIVENYESLADWTVFTQAAAPRFGFRKDEEDSGHMCSGVTWDDYITPKRDGWYEVQTVATRYPEMWHVDRFDMIFNIPESNGERCPLDSEDGWTKWWVADDHPLLEKQVTDTNFVPPIEFYNKYVVAGASDKTFHQFTLNYANGGRIAVSRDRIRKRPLSYYKALLHELSKSVNPIEGYYMETMWYDIFHPERLQAEYGPLCGVPVFPEEGASDHPTMFAEVHSRHATYLASQKRLRKKAFKKRNNKTKRSIVGGY